MVLKLRLLLNIIRLIAVFISLMLTDNCLIADNLMAMLFYEYLFMEYLNPLSI